MSGFSSLSEMIAFNAFNQNIMLIALYLNKKTANQFTALSMYFNNILLNPNSDFGRIFWKNLAVQNGGIKCFKSKRINYRFKQILHDLNEIKKDLTAHNVPRWCYHATCQRCGMLCCPDRFKECYYHDRHNLFCNCPITICDSRFEITLNNIESTKAALLVRKEELLRQMLRLDNRIEEFVKKEKKMKSIYKLKKMKPALKSINVNGRYKSTRTQAGNALEQIDIYSSWLVRERPNVNYKDQLGNGVGL